MRTLQTVAFLILAGAPWWAAWTLAGRSGERSLLWRHCAAGILAVAFVVACTSALGLLRALALGPAVALCLLLPPCAWLWRPALPARRLPLRALRRGPVLFAVLVVAAVAAVLLARGLGRPILDWDSLSYHLPRSAHWLQERTLGAVPIPDAMTSYNRFPWNGALLGTWLMLPFHDDSLVGLANLPFLVLTGLAVAGIAFELGVAATTRALLALHVCLSPLLLVWATTAAVENQLVAELAAGAWFLVRAWRRGNAWDVLLMLAAFGLAVGTKLTAIVPAGVAGAALLARDVARRRAGGWALGLALFLVLAAPRYVLNAWETGNPLYPVQTTFSACSSKARRSTNVRSASGARATPRASARAWPTCSAGAGAVASAPGRDRWCWRSCRWRWRCRGCAGARDAAWRWC
jgi:hypothetical protein